MIMTLKNPMPVTKEDFPYLFYDVDRVGSGSNIRFVYFGFLKDQAVSAATSLLAFLQRNFSDDYVFDAHFSLIARDDAAVHPWTTKDRGYAEGKSRTGIDMRMIALRSTIQTRQHFTFQIRWWMDILLIVINSSQQILKCISRFWVKLKISKKITQRLIDSSREYHLNIINEIQKGNFKLCNLEGFAK